MSAGLKANADGSAAIQVGGSDAITITSGLAVSLPTGNFAFNSGYGSAATAYGCRAWVNFNGTGTVAIRASGNVTSITDNGVGDYTVNFTNAMSDTNYAGVWSSTGINTYPALGIGDITSTWVTTTFIRGRYFVAATLTDLASVNLAVFR